MSAKWNVQTLKCTRDQPTELLESSTAAQLHVEFSPCSQILASDDIITTPLLLFEASVEVTHDHSYESKQIVDGFITAFM